MARTAALLAAAAVLCWGRATNALPPPHGTADTANYTVFYHSDDVQKFTDQPPQLRTQSVSVTDNNKNNNKVLNLDLNRTRNVNNTTAASALAITNNQLRNERSRFFSPNGDYIVDTSISNIKTKTNRTLVDRSAIQTKSTTNDARHLPVDTPIYSTTFSKSNHRQYSPISNDPESLLKAIKELNNAAIVVRTTSSNNNNNNNVGNKMHFSDDLDIPIVQIVNTSDAESLRRRLEMSTEFFLVPEKPTTSTVAPTTIPSIITRSSVTSEKPIDLILSPRVPVFRNEVWVVPVLALSSVCMLMIAGFEVFVLCKAWRTTPSRRHLFLGQMLLLGLFACAGLGGVLALAPSQATCATIRFGAGVAYALVFASLLVKCVFLISLNGGVYLPAPYQGLLLLFAVLIQVAIGAQWLLTTPPIVDFIQVEEPSVPPPRHRLLVTAEDVTTAQQIHQITLCRTPYIDILFSLCYVLFLIVFVAILAIKSRGIRDNYREATYIGLSVGCTIPIWLVWTLSGLVVGERHRDACLAFGLVITAAVIFLVMFMPKGRQLAAMGKDGVFLEDREDRFSSLSRAGSGYSPSFFHFKPIKYGTKHQPPPATITTLGADRVALCPAPPTYSRMFHCYPSPQYYYHARYLAGGVFLRPDDGNVYTTLEPTLSSNPNVYFQRGNGMHPGMMY